MKKISIVLLLILFTSCSSHEYNIDYSVNVSYINGNKEELHGVIKALISNVDNVQFTLSERLRKEPCLLLVEGVEFNSISNIAYGVQSFTVNRLDIKQKKH